MGVSIATAGVISAAWDPGTRVTVGEVIKKKPEAVKVIPQVIPDEPSPAVLTVNEKEEKRMTIDRLGSIADQLILPAFAKSSSDQVEVIVVRGGYLTRVIMILLALSILLLSWAGWLRLKREL